MNLLAQAEGIIKQAGDWSNYWSEVLGTVTGSAVGGGLGMIAAHHLPSKYTLPIMAGSIALPDTLGFLTGFLSKRRTEAEQRAIDDNKKEILSNLLIPGRAFYNRTSRAFAHIDDSDRENNLFPENVGQFVSALVPGSTELGALIGAVVPGRTKEEQDTYDRSRANMLLNMLPGVAGYSMAQRIKADYK